jgi:hypothetical protein
MRKFTIIFLLPITFSLIAFAWLSFSKTGKKINAFHGPKVSRTYKFSSAELLKLQWKAVSAKSFTKQNHFDTSICFLVDMSLPANHKRFFVYDFSRDTILNSGLVAHGNCNQYWLQGRKYGNEIGCGCTSFGKYKIGNSYYGRFGLAFKLYGLERTNSNAFKRYVVLHSHSCVPDKEVAEEICQSNGCPTVSPNFLKQLEPMIKNSKRPILLWMFE